MRTFSTLMWIWCFNDSAALGPLSHTHTLDASFTILLPFSLPSLVKQQASLNSWLAISLNIQRASLLPTNPIKCSLIFPAIKSSASPPPPACHPLSTCLALISLAESQNLMKHRRNLLICKFWEQTSLSHSLYRLQLSRIFRLLVLFSCWQLLLWFVLFCPHCLPVLAVVTPPPPPSRAVFAFACCRFIRSHARSKCVAYQQALALSPLFLSLPLAGIWVVS